MRRLLGVAAAIAVAFSGMALAPQPAAAGPKAGAQKYAVLVGIDAYRGRVPKLVGSVGDAQDLREVLIRAGWPAGNIRMLLNDQATAAAIRESWKWLISQADDNSFSVFHYSGHIKQMSGDRDRDGEKLDEYLWPVDNGYLSDAEFSHYMRHVRGWSWVNVAGCEGAGLNDGMAAFNRFFTAASMEHEKAYESPSWRNSVFVGLLADYGLLQRQGDLNGDRRITLMEAFEYANRNAPRLTANQRRGPQHPYRAGGDGVEWFLETPAASAPSPPPPSSASGGSGGSSQPQPRPTTTTTAAPCRHYCEPGDDPSR